MESQSTLDVRKLNTGQIGLTFAAILMFLGQLCLVVAGTLFGGPFDGFIQLFPWALVCTVLFFSFWTSERVALGLLSAATAMMLNLALGFLYAVPILLGNTRVVWSSNAPAYIEVGFSKSELIQVGTGKNPFILFGDILLWVGAILTLIFVAFIFLGLRKFLTGPTRKSSFSIDINVLLVIFVVAVGFEFYRRYSWPGAFGTGTIGFMLLTYLPLVLWLSFTLRQVGVVSIGSASGFVAAVALVPIAMLLITLLFGGSSASYVTEDGNIAGSGQNAYDILNPMGVFSSVVGVSLLLTFVVLWWNFGIYSHQQLSERDLATTSSKVNSLSVLAFLLSWIPLTSIPANILGHMAYDQILHQSESERGLGLSKAAIILSYISLFAGVFAIYSIWLS